MYIYISTYFTSAVAVRAHTCQAFPGESPRVRVAAMKVQREVVGHFATGPAHPYGAATKQRLLMMGIQWGYIMVYNEL